MATVALGYPGGYAIAMSVIVDGRTKLTYEEYRHFPDDGRRHEIIDGAHYVSPSPSSSHQNASRHIQFALYEQIEKSGVAQVFNAPMDLELSPVDVVQPDLIVVLNARREIVLPSRIRGVPDLIVEILSPSTFDRDRTLKLSLYELRGVPEYWVVDTEDRSVLNYTRGESGYGEPEVCRESISFLEATVDLSEVWRRL
ncbi:MAG: Uma2 family endonuclease [Spirochaetaceae bacterium]